VYGLRDGGENGRRQFVDVHEVLHVVVFEQFLIEQFHRGDWRDEQFRRGHVSTLRDVRRY
jgi:hypothetical protein